MKIISFGIIDYGAGNLGNVHRVLDHLGVRNRIIDTPEQIEESEALILPGVGSFAAGMEGLQQKDLIKPLFKAIDEGKSFLGICLGMQLLFESSEEAAGVSGLGLFSGELKHFPVEMVKKVPHMGWNRLDFIDKASLAEGLDNYYFYFVHSYYLPLNSETQQYMLASCSYGDIDFVAAVKKDNITAVQPHPEKSGTIGLEFLYNFVKEAKS